MITSDQKPKLASIHIEVQIAHIMAAKAPVEIGAKGTIGSLLMQEITHYSQSNLVCREIAQKPKPLRSETVSQKTKKRGRSKFLSVMCSMVEVTNGKSLNGAAGFDYRDLKTDGSEMF